MSAPPLFITGTGTGVGKTVLTGLLTAHARAAGIDLWPLKPLCSGGRDDAALLAELRGEGTALDAVNRWHFPDPVTPLLAARLSGVRVALKEVAEWIGVAGRGRARVVVEGAGGLLSPLGEGFAAPELITALGARVAVVAANQLGVLNSTLLTCGALGRLGVDWGVVLMSHGPGDESSGSNAALLRELLPSPARLWEVPPLPAGVELASRIRAQAADSKVAATLGEILAWGAESDAGWGL